MGILRLNCYGMQSMRYSTPPHPKWTCCAMFHICWYQFKKQHFINMGTLAVIVLSMQSMRYFTHWDPALPHVNKI